MEEWKRSHQSGGLVQITMRSKRLCAAGKLPDGSTFTTSYFTVDAADNSPDCIVLRLVRPVFRKFRLFVQTNQCLILRRSCICAIYRHPDAVLSWTELKELSHSSGTGHVCIVKSAEDRTIYQNHSVRRSIAFISFTYKKGKKQTIRLRVTSRTRAPLLLTVRKGQTVSAAAADLLRVEAVSTQTDIQGIYTAVIHSVHSRRISGGCSGLSFIEKKLLAETVEFCAAEGDSFWNHTEETFYAAVSATNKSGETAKIIINGTAEINIAPYSTCTTAVQDIRSISILGKQQLEMRITIHMLV